MPSSADDFGKVFDGVPNLTLVNGGELESWFGLFRRRGNLLSTSQPMDMPSTAGSVTFQAEKSS